LNQVRTAVTLFASFIRCWLDGAFLVHTMIPRHAKAAPELLLPSVPSPHGPHLSSIADRKPPRLNSLDGLLGLVSEDYFEQQFLDLDIGTHDTPEECVSGVYASDLDDGLVPLLSPMVPGGYGYTSDSTHVSGHNSPNSSDSRSLCSTHTSLSF